MNIRVASLLIASAVHLSLIVVLLGRTAVPGYQKLSATAWPTAHPRY